MKPKPRTKAEVFEEKAANARQRAEETVRAGQCPRCDSPVLYARSVGLLTVVDAVPFAEPEWIALAAHRATYNLVGHTLQARTAAARSLGAREGLAVYAEHTTCGKPIPVPYPPVPKIRDPWGDVPPFEPHPARCGVCGKLVVPTEQAYTVEYLGMYMTQCQIECEPADTPAGRKLKYPRLDKFGKRMKAAKGEVGFGEWTADE